MAWTAGTECMTKNIYVARRWAIQITPDTFFIDTWVWKAMPFIDEDTLGESEFGGAGCRSEEAAKEMAQAECMKRGLNEAVLLGPDDVDEE